MQKISLREGRRLRQITRSLSLADKSPVRSFFSEVIRKCLSSIEGGGPEYHFPVESWDPRI